MLHFHADPAFDPDAFAWHQDGLLLVEDGKVKAMRMTTSACSPRCRPAPRCAITAARSSCRALSIPTCISRRPT
ncbi:hypothetical protein LP420_11580 [Massilia sp. B-10]|nr:hypothetical protein LP420_11580 [Massilia sp. B-10]